MELILLLIYFWLMTWHVMFNISLNSMMIQGSFYVCAQPMRDGIALQCRLSLAGRIHIINPGWYITIILWWELRLVFHKSWSWKWIRGFLVPYPAWAIDPCVACDGDLDRNVSVSIALANIAFLSWLRSFWYWNIWYLKVIHDIWFFVLNWLAKHLSILNNWY